MPRSELKEECISKIRVAKMQDQLEGTAINFIVTTKPKVKIGSKMCLKSIDSLCGGFIFVATANITRREDKTHE